MSRESLTVQDLCDRFGISYGAVKRIAKKYGLPFVSRDLLTHNEVKRAVNSKKIKSHSWFSLRRKQSETRANAH